MTPRDSGRRRLRTLAGCGVLVLAASLVQATAARAAPCADDLEAGWSAIEALAWSTLVAGEAFDGAALAGPETSARDDAGPTLSGAFLRDILTCERLFADLPEGLITLRGVRVPDAVDLSHKTVRARFDCDGCALDGVEAVESRWLGTVRLLGTTVRDALDFTLARFDASLMLEDADIGGALYLSSAQIGGDLVISSSRLGALAADSASIARSVELRGAEIGDHADLWGIEITRDLVLTGDDGGRRTVIGSAVPIEALRNIDATTPPVLSLGSAKINRRISVADTLVNGRLDMDAVRVTEDLWLRSCSMVVGPINLVFARIGQNIDFSSTILSDVDLTGARIGGELRLGAPSGRLTAPVWKPGGRLVLRNVELSSWTDATGNATPRSDACVKVRGTPDPWPDRIDVIGFAYQNVEGFGGGAAIMQHDVGWFCRWLERQAPYSFEPYQHAAAYLRRDGLEAEAADVLYCGKVRQIANTPSWSGKFVLQVQRGFVGFGYRVERSLIWALLFILVGQQVFSRTREAKAHGMPFGLAYSIEMFIPALSLRPIHADIDLSGWQRYYFYLHKFMGWVLGSFVVASFLGLLGE